MNTDKLHCINPQRAVQAAYTAVTAVQHLIPEEQLAGISLLLYAMATNTGQDISHLMSLAERVTKDADSNYHTEIRALTHYVKDNLK